MLHIGYNVSPDGGVLPSRLASSIRRGDYVRVVLTPWHDLREYLWTLKFIYGFKVVAVIANESFNHGEWSFEQGFKYYIDKYGGLVDFIQLGNEWDHVSESSWTLDPITLGDLLWDFQGFRHNGIPIILGGAVSGDPNFLEHVDLSLVDKVAVHPYGRGPTPNYPFYFGYYGDLIQAYYDKIRSMGFEKEVIITELGVRDDELAPLEKAAYLSAFVQNAVCDIIFFCAHDYVDYGIFDTPSELAIKQVLGVIDMPETFEYHLGIKAKANELGLDKVGKALEPETYPFPGAPYSFQMSEKGLFVYSAKANKVHFFAGA